MSAVRIVDNSLTVASLVNAKTEVGVQLAAEYLRGKANVTIPRASGAMQATGDVTREREGWVVSYDTPYAAYQHEEDLRHPDPTNPESSPLGERYWLKNAGEREHDEMLAIIAKAAKL